VEKHGESVRGGGSRAGFHMVVRQEGAVGSLRDEYQHLPTNAYLATMANTCAVCRNPARSVERVYQRDAFDVDCAKCGTYRVSGSAEMVLRHDQWNDQRHLLSGVLRNASASGTRLEVLADDIERLIDQAPQHQPLPKLLDDVLLFVYEHSLDLETIDAAVALTPGDDYPLFYLRSGHEVTHLIRHLEAQKLIELPFGDPTKVPMRLTIAGWNRATELASVRGRPDQAFVAMSFDKSLDSLWLAIRAALRRVGYRGIRVDREHYAERIDDRILAEIRRSGLVVADFTLHRQGVYFEAGFALALNTPVVWCCREDDVKNLHFDTRQYPHLTWEMPAQLNEKIQDRVRGLGLARPEIPDDDSGASGGIGENRVD
jgi:hypothetical protein